MAIDTTPTIRRFLLGEMDEKHFALQMTDPLKRAFYTQIRRAEPIAPEHPLRSAQIDEMLQDFFSGQKLSAREAGLLKHSLLHDPANMLYTQRFFDEIETMKNYVPPAGVNTGKDWLPQLGISSAVQRRAFSGFFRPAYMLAAAILIFAVLFVYRTGNAPNALPDITFDDHLPVDYIGYMQRGAGTTDGDVPLSFRDAFREGMADYLTLDYAAARSAWKKAETTARQLAQAHDPLPVMVRDFYFYSGLNDLALALSKKSPPETARKTTLLNEAAHYLRLSAEQKSVALYYRALIAARLGQISKARALLQKIPQKDPYYSFRTILESKLMAEKEK